MALRQRRASALLLRSSLTKRCSSSFFNPSAQRRRPFTTAAASTSAQQDDDDSKFVQNPAPEFQDWPKVGNPFAEDCLDDPWLHHERTYWMERQRFLQDEVAQAWAKPDSNDKVWAHRKTLEFVDHMGPLQLGSSFTGHHTKIDVGKFVRVNVDKLFKQQSTGQVHIAGHSKQVWSESNEGMYGWLLFRHEHAALNQLLRDVEADSAQAASTVVIDGEQGSGKSVLVNYAHIFAAQNGWLSLWIPDGEQLVHDAQHIIKEALDRPYVYYQDSVATEIFQRLLESQSDVLKQVKLKRSYPPPADWDPEAEHRRIEELRQLEQAREQAYQQWLKDKEHRRKLRAKEITQKKKEAKAAGKTFDAVLHGGADDDDEEFVWEGDRKLAAAQGAEDEQDDEDFDDDDIGQEDWFGEEKAQADAQAAEEGNVIDERAFTRQDGLHGFYVAEDKQDEVTLFDMVSFACREHQSKQSSLFYDFCEELKLTTEVPVLVAVDRVNAWDGDKTDWIVGETQYGDYNDEEYNLFNIKHLHPRQLSVVDALSQFQNANSLANGVCVWGLSQSNGTGIHMPHPKHSKQLHDLVKKPENNAVKLVTQERYSIEEFDRMCLFYRLTWRMGGPPLREDIMDMPAEKFNFLDNPMVLEESIVEGQQVFGMDDVVRKEQEQTERQIAIQESQSKKDRTLHPDFSRDFTLVDKFSQTAVKPHVNLHPFYFYEHSDAEKESAWFQQMAADLPLKPTKSRMKHILENGPRLPLSHPPIDFALEAECGRNPQMMWLQAETR